MQNNTLTLTQTGQNHAIQELIPDYTGIYCFCITILISVIILGGIAYKIWRELKKDILEFLNELNTNIREYLYGQKH